MTKRSKSAYPAQNRPGLAAHARRRCCKFGRWEGAVGAERRRECLRARPEPSHPGNRDLKIRRNILKYLGSGRVPVSPLLTDTSPRSRGAAPLIQRWRTVRHRDLPRPRGPPSATRPARPQSSAQPPKSSSILPGKSRHPAKDPPVPVPGNASLWTRRATWRAGYSGWVWG